MLEAALIEAYETALANEEAEAAQGDAEPELATQF